MLRGTCLSLFKQSNVFSIIYKNNRIKHLNFSTVRNTSVNFNTSNNISQGKLTENEFLVKVKNDPDKFGTEIYNNEDDPDDLKEEEYLKEKPFNQQKLSTKQYADIIKPLLKKRKLKEAIDVVEIRMLKEDRVKPENYIYNLLIGGCGRVGYTKKAFALYNEMKKRALKVTPGTYTALFNACANSPWPQTDGLTRAAHLRNIMIEKMYEPNLTNYNAMIKAFGRGGDLKTAFSIVDDMLAKGIAIEDDTLNFLLQACITDKEAGFRHALLVWRKFIQKNIKPSLYSYNLMLRCIRDCELGDIEATKNVINLIMSKNESNLLQIEEDSKMIAANSNALTTDLAINKPNLMAPVPCFGNIVALSEVKKPEDRLLLVGGCSGFLEDMINNECTPDIKTFSQLLDNIPNTLAAEKELLKIIRKHGVKPDLDFFNMLIKKRSTRFDYASAKEVLTMIKTAGYRPNLITYGVLAIGCTTKEEALEFLDAMSKASYRMNIEILGAMLTQACHHNSFPYVLHLMDNCINEGIDPSQKFMDNLETFRKKSKHISNDSNNPLSKSEGFQKGYKAFKWRYKTWKNEINIQDTNTHPWQQYRQTNDADVRHYKDKEAKSRFKPVHTSLYRRKTKIKKVN